MPSAVVTARPLRYNCEAMALTRDEELALVALVGAGLVKLGLKSHAQHCRDYYRRVRDGRPQPARHETAWGRGMVIGWAKILHIPPYENAFAERPRGSRCTCATPRLVTETTFPKGWVVACHGCEARWIERDDPR